MTDLRLEPRRRITGAARQAAAAVIVAKYEAGMSFEAIAARLGRSYGFVSRIIHETDVEVRAQGGGWRKKTPD